MHKPLTFQKFFKKFAVEQVVFLVTFLFFLSLYATTLPRTIVGYGDSDILLSAGYNLGLAHPPGYALNIFLLYLTTHAPLPLSVAMKGHLLSAMLHSATLGILGLANFELLQYLSQGFKKINRWQVAFMSLIPSGLLGGSYLFWQYSIVAEKYPLNNFFAACLLLMAVVMVLEKRRLRAHIWVLLGMIVGVSLFHHQTIVLLLPMVGYALWRKRREMRCGGKFVFAGFSGAVLFSLGLLIFINARNVPINWKFNPTFSGLVSELTRQELSGTIVTTGESRSLYLMDFNLAHSIKSLQTYGVQLLSYFSAPAIILLLLGIWYCLKHRKEPVCKLLGIGFITTTFFIPGYLKWPDNLASQALIQRQYLLSYIVLPSFFLLGAWSVLTALLKITQRLATPLILISSGLMLLLLLVANYGQVNLHGYELSRIQYEKTLTNLPENTVLICISDVSCFALLYLHHVEGVRTDVTLIPSAYRFIEHSLDTMPVKAYGYRQHPFFLLDYISQNVGSRPVYVVDMQKTYYDYLGMDYGFFQYLPRNYVGQIAKESSDLEMPQDYSSTDMLLSQPFPKLDLMRQQVYAAAMQTHLLNAMQFSYQGNSNVAESNFEYAQKLAQFLPEKYQQSVLATQQQYDQVTDYKPYGGKEIVELSEQELLSLIHQSLGVLDSHSAFQGLMAATLRYPNNRELRELLARTFEEMGEFDKAQVEHMRLNGN